MSTRRELLVVLGAGALAMPLSSLAQPQGKVWRVGYLDPRTKATSDEYYTGFVSRMRELGYVEGKNLQIERRVTDGNREQMRRMANELVQMNVDVIITDSTPAVRAVLAASKTVPIVSAAIGDPVSSGLANSLARPGGNVTGFSNLSGELNAKRLEMLIQIAPVARHIGYLVNVRGPANALATLVAAAKSVGRTFMQVAASTPQEIDAAFAQMQREKVQALLIGQDGFLSSNAKRIGELALKYRLPSIGGRVQIAEGGAALSYGVDYIDLYRRAAVHVDKILKGTKAGDIPFEQAVTFDLAVNMKTIKTLGITVPQTLMVRATKVIE